MKDFTPLQPCTKWAKKLALTRSEDLSPSDQSKLMAHLDKCPACSNVLLEYRMMDACIRNYPDDGRLSQLSPPLPIPEYELHRLHLLLSRQMERRRSLILLLTGMLFLCLILLCLFPLLPHPKIGVFVPTMGCFSVMVSLYFLWSGLASFFASFHPVTIEDVKKFRSQTRRKRYLHARGEQRRAGPLHGQKKMLLIRITVMILGSICLLCALKTSSMLTWAYLLLISGTVCLIGCILLLDALHLAPQQRDEQPGESRQELARRFTSGELATVQGPNGSEDREASE